MGDFVGLDDLMTGHPRVIAEWISLFVLSRSARDSLAVPLPSLSYSVCAVWGAVPQ